MSLLDKKTSSDLVKLVIFMLVTAVATSVLVVLIGNITFTSTQTYKAVFSDATGLVKGDDIRAAGVKVGSVSSVDIVHRTDALVTFTVDKSVALTKSSEATIKFRNLVGQRYVALTPGDGDRTRLKAESTIPLSRTHPALDLTILFNGFKPLFAALTPSDVNKLSYEIVKVFQGEGGTIEGLMRSTASVTSTLADRDQVIGQMIDNLNVVLRTISDRNRQLSSLLVELRSFLHGLVQDRGQILGSLNSISNLAQQTSDLVVGIRPSFVRDVKGLRRVAGNLKRGRREIDRALGILPIKLTKIGRTGSYGSFFNFYLCHFQGRVALPTGGSVTISYKTANDRGRCELK